MLQRLATSALKEWKSGSNRKPLLLDGARQVGKTWLVEKIFGPQEFRHTHRLDFQRNPEWCALFEPNLDPRRILSDLELRLDTRIDLQRDLVFFDEVGECQGAVDSLKYFAEQLPEAFVCASGSNIGLLRSFPVGKVRMLTLSPLCFEEFVMACERPLLLEAFRERQPSPAAHQLLWPLLLDFYFVGGMPEAVACWFRHQGDPLRQTVDVAQIHRELLASFSQDFGKYAGSTQAQHIHAVFHNIPRQLSSNQDGSVRRYRFKNVVENKRRYMDLRGPIDWLETTRLAQKCYPVSGRPSVPLLPLTKPNIFKLYLFDVGLLGHMLGLSYAEQRQQGFAFKGFVAENFVQNELCTHVGNPTYSWGGTHAEIEFLHRTRSGDIIPVEVKSGARTRARSLSTYLSQCRPPFAIKLVGGLGGKNGGIETWPLYHAQFLRDL